MNRIALPLFALLALTSCATKDSPTAFDARDESAMRAVVSEYAATWNRRDMKGMHDLDTDDVEWINVAGNTWHGRADVQRGHDVILKTIFAATNVTILDVDVRSLAPGVAVAVATMRFAPLKDAAGKDMAEIRSRGSFTMLKRDGLWKIAHFQNTTIDTLAEKIGDPLTWPNGIPPFPAPDGKK